jgi:SAM-dependent methyltransferase
MASPLTGVSQAWSQVAEEYQRHIVPGFLPAARTLCESIGIRGGDIVLDVACGPGTAAFVAEELGAALVMGIDFARSMVFLAQRRRRNRETAQFVMGDASALPFASQRFDAVVSSFGLIFAPDPVGASAEAARMLRGQGRLGLLAWDPAGTVSVYQRTAFQYLEVHSGAHDPFRWGDAVQARAWLEPFAEVEIFPIEVPFRADSATMAWHILRTAMGRIAAGYAMLDPATQARLDADMIEFLDRFRERSGAIYWPREAVVIRGVRR